MAIPKLIFSELRHRKARTLLTVLAIALSVSLVVAVTTGYSSVRATIFKYFLEYVGRTDVEIRNRSGEIDQDEIREVLSDKDVLHAVGRLEVKTGLIDNEGRPLKEQAAATFIGIKLPDDVDVTGLKMEPGTDGSWFSGSTGDYAVIDQQVAELLKLKIGDCVLMPAQPRPGAPMPSAALPTTNPFGPPLKLQVVAVVHKPQIAALFNKTIYVPLTTLQEFTGNQGKVTRIMVDLKPGAADKAFVDRWRAKFPWLKLKPASESRSEVDKHLHGAEMLSFLGGTVAMLAAMFIIFSTLSMGVVERQRSLGMLRAIGAYRGQIARLVLAEAVILSVAGAAVGIPAGLIAVKVLAVWKPDYFLAGVVPSAGGILFGSLGSIVSALAASLLPAFMASRVDVIESLSAAGQPPSPKVPWIAAAIGLALLGVDPLLMFGPALFSSRGLFSETVTYYAHFFVGIPSLMVGFFLLAPIFVWAVEKTLGRAVMLLMGLKHSLLAQQLSGQIWRSAGTAAALMVGLAILVVMHTQGNSMLSGWHLPEKFPDIFIFSLQGMPPPSLRDVFTKAEPPERILERIRKCETTIEGIDGVWKRQVLPIGFTISRVMQSVSPIGADSAMFFGIEPEKGLQMMGLEFLEGGQNDAVRLLQARETALRLIKQRDLNAAADALQNTQYETARRLLLNGRAADAEKQLLRQGGYVIITDELRQLRGLHKGDKLRFTGQAGVPPYTVAAVVWSPAIDLFVAQFDMMQQFEERSVGSAFGTMEDAVRDFGVTKVHLFAANLDWGTDKYEIEQRVRQKVGAMGLIMGDVRHIKAEVTKGFRKLLLLLSTVAMAAILVAALGVANTIIASVRSRRWQLGVLRSVGLTQWQMLRLILAEAILLALVACLLGVSAGLLMSLDANQFGWWVLGYKPRIVVPMDIVLEGVLIVLSVSLIASFWPAVATARKEPLELLQGGRAG